MRHATKGLASACVLLILVTTIWEFWYYSNDRESSGHWRRVVGYRKAANFGKVDRSPPQPATVGRLGGSLQDLVDGNVQLPIQSGDSETLEQQDSGIEQGKIFAAGEELQRNLPFPAVILFCYNRVNYLNETLRSLAALPGLDAFTVYISQDGYDHGVAELVSNFTETLLKPPATRAVEHWQHLRQPLISAQQPGHAWLTQHYRWGLGRVFDERQHTHAVVVEDDMLFSNDFLAFFGAMAPLLERDPSLWCISTWNDNGLAQFDWRNDGAFRTSYFPGLGWMLRRQLWEELRPGFPLQAWDHWMRLDSVAKGERRLPLVDSRLPPGFRFERSLAKEGPLPLAMPAGRECVCPEVNRNRNIGEKGANMQKSVFKRYLSQMAWSMHPVWDWGDLSYLHLPLYKAHLSSLLSGAQVTRQRLAARAIATSDKNKVWLMPYKGEDYVKLARVFRIWPFPRGHHHHLTVLPYQGSTVLLADERFCEMLPGELRVHPAQTLQAVPGATAESCDSACGRSGLACRADDFWFINSCEVLTAHFACERGCAVELGADVPNYVTDPGLPTFQTCLVTQSMPKCYAFHNSTRRLCPCAEAA